MNGVHCQTSARIRAKKIHGLWVSQLIVTSWPSDLAQDVVGRAEGALQQQRPELADDHRADEERHDQDRHDERRGRGTRAPWRARGRGRGTNSMATLAAESIAVSSQRPARDGVVDHALEVLQADEGVAGDLEVVVDEGDDQREEQRIDRQRQDEEDRRRDQQPLEIAVGPARQRREPRRRRRRTCRLRGRLRLACGLLCLEWCRRGGGGPPPAG